MHQFFVPEGSRNQKDAPGQTDAISILNEAHARLICLLENEQGCQLAKDYLDYFSTDFKSVIRISFENSFRII